MVMAQIIDDSKISRYRIRNVFQSLRLGRSLRMATGKPGHGHGETFFRLLKYHAIFHT